MTDAHCHVSSGDAGVRELVVGRDFLGIHPWECLEPAFDMESVVGLRQKLMDSASVGVGEIGLDRLKVREIPQVMRKAFEDQLEFAIELRRPVVLHGAKCWGQVVAAISRREIAVRLAGIAFLFHGFSRSEGLIPAMVSLNGFVSVGPTVLNDHAVNYRELVKRIPVDRLLVETDRTEANRIECPSVAAVLAKVAELRGMSFDAAENLVDRNAERFVGLDAIGA